MFASGRRKESDQRQISESTCPGWACQEILLLLGIRGCTRSLIITLIFPYKILCTRVDVAQAMILEAHMTFEVLSSHRSGPQSVLFSPRCPVIAHLRVQRVQPGLRLECEIESNRSSKHGRPSATDILHLNTRPGACLELLRRGCRVHAGAAMVAEAQGGPACVSHMPSDIVKGLLRSSFQ